MIFTLFARITMEGYNCCSNYKCNKLSSIHIIIPNKSHFLGKEADSGLQVEG